MPKSQFGHANGNGSGDLGKRIRDFRHLRRLSLSKVAERAGISVSFLSQLERGKTNASVSSLRDIADALGITLSDLFDEGGRPSIQVLRAENRPLILSDSGARKYMITRSPLRHVEVFAGEFDPGSSTGPQPYTHGDSQEVFMVLSGTVTHQVADQEYVLGAGDSIEYQSSQPHRTENSGEDVAKVLWIVSPVTATEEAQER